MQETQEMCVQSLDLEDSLEEGMATHSGILTWTIPWTEEPGGLQSIGSQRFKIWAISVLSHFYNLTWTFPLFTLSGSIWCASIHPSSLSHIVAPLGKPSPIFPHIRLVFQFLGFYDNSHYANMLLLTSIKTQSLPNSNVRINHTEAWVKCWFWLIWAQMARSKTMHFLQVPMSCWFFWSWTTLWLNIYIYKIPCLFPFLTMDSLTLQSETHSSLSL